MVTVLASDESNQNIHADQQQTPRLIHHSYQEENTQHHLISSAIEVLSIEAAFVDENKSGDWSRKEHGIVYDSRFEQSISLERVPNIEHEDQRGCSDNQQHDCTDHSAL